MTANIEAIYPLSPMQEGMLFHTLYAPGSGIYVQQLHCALPGPVQVDHFKAAWAQVSHRYGILRTLFVWEDQPRPLQVVRQQVALPWTEYDWRGLSPAGQQARLTAWLETDQTRGFNLGEAPLMRLVLARTGSQAYRFIWSFHHLLLDGWSTSLVFHEVCTRYEALSRGETLAVEPGPAYKTYIGWLQKQDMQAMEAYWRETLHGFETPTPIPVKQTPPGPVNPAPTFQAVSEILSPALSHELQQLARQQQVTLNTIFQGAWAVLLSRYSGETDVLFGHTVSGRPAALPQVETMVGLFINTLPVRIEAPLAGRLTDWLPQIQAQQATARQYEHSPLARVQQWSDLPPGQSLFDSLLVFENYPLNDTTWTQSDTLTVADLHFLERTNYPLTLTIVPGGAIWLELSYNTDNFDAATVRRMLDHLAQILHEMTARPEQPLAALSLLTQAEQQQILHDWNATEQDYPRDACIHHLFEARAAETPEALALVSDDNRLSYAALNARANQLAHYLRETRPLGPESIVGICLDKSPEMLVAILGVLKAGAAYLPLDPTYPAERLAYMIDDARVSFILTQARLADSLPPGVTPFSLDANKATLHQYSPANPSSPVTAANLAYVIYTSGSTGQAKGVMVSHESLVNAYHAWADAYELGPGDAHLQMATFSFDVFSGDWVRALVSGGKLVLCPWAVLTDPPRLYALMRREAITCAEFVPAVMRLLLTHLTDTGQSLAFMRILIVASDSWYVEEYQRIRQVCGPETRLLNSYGLTEATIDSTYFDGGDLALPPDQLVPIGRPFANTRLYLLDEAMQPVPVGVPGELHLSGPGLARGYLHRPGLTAERFGPNPFGPPGSRLYKTGDLARYLPDGTVEFMGRLDHQVKIRGFRVEVGEIEAVLNQHPAVQQAAVLVNAADPTNKQLVAYLSPAVPDELGLRQFIRQKLPDYMLPALFIGLETLPLTPNGKIDRRALAALALDPRTPRETAPPRTPLEATLVDLWREVLDTEPIGIHDNFFARGGHSLLAIQLISRIRKNGYPEVELCWLTDAPTVETLARMLTERTAP